MTVYVKLVGDFLFRYRNVVFPLVVLSLVFAFSPAATVFGSVTLLSAKDAMAVLSVVSGLSIRALVIAFAYIRRGGRKKAVYAKTLVVSGMFGVCRNPLYVGNLMIYFGIFLLHGNPLVVLAGTLFFMLAYVCIIAAEEAFLNHTFGAEYRSYCLRVPRWSMSLTRVLTQTRGLPFDLQRVLMKDYTTIASATTAVIVVASYRMFLARQSEIPMSDIAGPAVLMLLIALATGVVKYWKRRLSRGS